MNHEFCLDCHAEGGIAGDGQQTTVGLDGGGDMMPQMDRNSEPALRPLGGGRLPLSSHESCVRMALEPLRTANGDSATQAP